MKLMTTQLETALKNNVWDDNIPLREHPVFALFVNPDNPYQQWYVMDGRQLANGDWILEGIVHILTWEYGSFYLSSLERIKLLHNSDIQTIEAVFNIPLHEAILQNGKHLKGYEFYL